MKFRALQENLRKAMLERIDGGQLTGLGLARSTGFKQAHISNFLNRKRALSLEGMDRVLATQHMSVLDLLDPAEINKRASILLPSQDEFENVVLTERSAASNPQIINDRVKQVLKFRKSFLRRLRTDSSGGHERWERFIALKVDKYDGSSMYPRLQPGATVLVDRHYISLKPYRKGEVNIYAVQRAKTCAPYLRRDGRRSTRPTPAQSCIPGGVSSHGIWHVVVRLHPWPGLLRGSGTVSLCGADTLVRCF